MSKNKGKMINYINYRMRVTLLDGRQLVGQMIAFDKHMNIVLADCEEFRKVKRKLKGSSNSAAPGAANPENKAVVSEEKRMLGLVILRGSNVVGASVDGPPPADPSLRVGTNGPPPPSGVGAPAIIQPGTGMARPAGRGAGLQGPAAGFGGPGFPGAGFPGGGPGGFGRGGGGPNSFTTPPGYAPGPPPGFQPNFPPPGGRGFR